MIFFRPISMRMRSSAYWKNIIISLLYQMKHLWQTMSRGLLIERIWSDGAQFVDENALSVTMRRLREKLPGIPVRTVYGIGYVWEK